MEPPVQFLAIDLIPRVDQSLTPRSRDQSRSTRSRDQSRSNRSQDRIDCDQSRIICDRFDVMIDQIGNRSRPILELDSRFDSDRDQFNCGIYPIDLIRGSTYCDELIPRSIAINLIPRDYNRFDPGIDQDRLDPWIRSQDLSRLSRSQD